MELACDQALHFIWLTKSLALAFPFACYSRVTSRDAPKWRTCSQARMEQTVSNQSSTISTTVNLSGLGNRSLSTYLRKGTGLSLPSNPWGRHSRSYHMYSYTSGLTYNCVCHHYTHWHLKDKRENSQGSDNKAPTKSTYAPLQKT